MPRWVVIASLVCIVIWSQLGAASPAFGAPLDAVASAAGSCDTSAGSSTYAYDMAPASLDYPIEQLTATGSADWYPSGAGETDVAPSDVAWAIDPRTGVGGVVDCFSASLSFNASLFEAPGTPATFSGISTALDQGSDPNDASNVEWIVPYPGAYRAVVTVTQGAVQVGINNAGSENPNPVTSSTTYDLNGVTPGPLQISITPVVGPAAHWTVSLAAVPAVLHASPVFPGIARPGHAQMINFSATVAGTLNAVVLGPDGSAIRNLEADAPETAGPHILTWNGRTNDGLPAPDGTYTIECAYTDDAGNNAVARTNLLVDSTRPTITFESPHTLRYLQPITIRVADQRSSISSGELVIDGRDVHTIDSGTLSYRPARDWVPGLRYSWSAVATDEAGNRRAASGSFTIKDPPRHLLTGSAKKQFLARFFRSRPAHACDYLVDVYQAGLNRAWFFFTNSGSLRPPPPSCVVGNGQVFVHRVRGQLRVVFQSSGIACFSHPVPGVPSLPALNSRGLPGVPAALAANLLGCKPRKP